MKWFRSASCIVVNIYAIAFEPGCTCFFSNTTGRSPRRATDGNTGAIIPGVDVTITSPSMIGGSRTAPTDETGTYRFSHVAVPWHLHRVIFALPAGLRR